MLLGGRGGGGVGGGKGGGGEGGRALDSSMAEFKRVSVCLNWYDLCLNELIKNGSL